MAMRTPRPLFALGLLAACAATSDAEDASSDDALSGAPLPVETHACEDGKVAKDATGATVYHCTKPFDAAPVVRLPADTVTGSTAKFYGSMTVPQTAENISLIWSRDGKPWVAVDAAGKPIPFGSSLPKALHAPTNRITFMVYAFEGTAGAKVSGPWGSATALHITKVRPAVMVDGCAFDSRLAGTWSGTVSERLETPTGGGPFARAFDDQKRVPIHLTLGSLTKTPNLQEYKAGPRISDAEVYSLSGSIDNFDHDVTVDGKTYPSLKGMGAKNPFLGAQDGKVELYRLGNMHGQQNDGHWVFTYPEGSQALTLNGMSFTLIGQTAASMLIPPEAKPPEELTSITIRPHIPFTVNGHTIVLTPEKVGGQRGQCR